jgi:hypothetical protein
MNDYEALEKLLEKSKMDDYMMYTKEDLIEFGQIVAKKCAKIADKAWNDAGTYPGNLVRKHFGVE